MKPETKRTSNGWTLLGQCTQWLIDNKNDLKENEMIVYLKIARNSFGFRHRFCYLKYEDFNISNRNTVSKVLKSLVEKKLISYSKTFKDGKQGYNEYRVIEPKCYIDVFVFSTTKNKEINNNILEEDDGWD